MKTWHIQIPIRVFDNDGNFVPLSDELRIDEPRRYLPVTMRGRDLPEALATLKLWLETMQPAEHKGTGHE